MRLAIETPHSLTLVCNCCDYAIEADEVEKLLSPELVEDLRARLLSSHGK